MIINNPASYYPSHYGSAPFTGMPNNYSTGPPPISPYYNPPFQQQPQHRPINQQNNENISSFKLYDIDTNEHSEIIRLIFSFVGVLYKDKRIKQDEWNKIKEQMSFEQLPILRINNQLKIFHLHAIIRYLAREFHLYGISKYDYAIVDMVLETTRQLQEKIFDQLKNSTDDEQKLNQFITDHSTIYLKQLEEFYEIFNRHGPFYLGSYISLADLIVYDTINYLIKIDTKLLENYSHLKEARRYLEKHPRISNYINTKTNNQNKTSHQKSPQTQRHRIKSPTPNINSHHHRHRSHDGHKSSHQHHHHHRHHHHRHHSKEPTPLSQTKQRSIRSSTSPGIQKKDKEATPLKTTDIIPPPPPVNTEEKSESTVN